MRVAFLHSHVCVTLLVFPLLIDSSFFSLFQLAYANIDYYADLDLLVDRLSQYALRPLDNSRTQIVCRDDTPIVRIVFHSLSLSIHFFFTNVGTFLKFGCSKVWCFMSHKVDCLSSISSFYSSSCSFDMLSYLSILCWRSRLKVNSSRFYGLTIMTALGVRMQIKRWSIASSFKLKRVDVGSLAQSHGFR